MSESIKRIVNGMQSLEDNEDGTLKGGYVSVTGGRHRIVIGDEGVPTPLGKSKVNEECASSMNHIGTTGTEVCHNFHCKDSDNDQCRNGICKGVTSGTINHQMMTTDNRSVF